MAAPSVDPIITRAELQMKTDIEGLLQDNGYFFDWGTVNQQDIAKVNFPCAMIWLDPDETNLDEAGGSWAQAYLNEVSFRIRVVGRMDEETSNPVFDNNVNLTKALHDLKKIFGTDYSLGGLVDSIMYLSSVRVFKRNNDIIIPSELETYWKVRYTQDRQTPTVIDP